MLIRGILPAILTPMNDDETINTMELKKQVRRQIEAGVHGIFCLGTNGEFYILSTEEKLLVMETVLSEVNGKLPVYAGTGCIGTKDSVWLTIQAQKLGVDAISVITPYFAAVSQDELVQHYTQIAQNTDLPVILYNIPARTGNTIAPETVSLLSKIPNIVGVKDSSGNFDNTLAYLQKATTGFNVLAGTDSLILWVLQAGGVGAVSGLANIIPKTIVSIYNSWENGDFKEAKAYQNSIRHIRACIALGNPNSVVKRAVNLFGQNVGPARQPVQGVNEKLDNAIMDALKHYEWELDIK